MLQLISWNTAGRIRVLPKQVEALSSFEPDLLALQEVTPHSRSALRDALRGIGFEQIVDSFELNPGPFQGPRRYGELLASRLPLEPLDPTRLHIPWPEKVLSALAKTPWGETTVHTVHVPPGSSNGWIKIETLEGLFSGIAESVGAMTILCGDFNTPQSEDEAGRVVTWGQRNSSSGEPRIRSRIRGKPGVRWDRAERAILPGLRPFGIVDAFRTLNGYAKQDYSWSLKRRGHSIGRRFDHVFCSGALRPTTCRYLHRLRESGLSDHSAIVAEFDGPAQQPPAHPSQRP